MAKKTKTADKKVVKKVETKAQETVAPATTEKPKEKKILKKSEAPASAVVETPAAETAVPAETAPAAEAPKVEEPPKPTKPAIPEGYCLTAGDWDGTEKNLWDPHSENCAECLSENPERYEACRLREQFLGTPKPKAAKAPGERTVKANGERPQSLQIDDMIRASAKYEDMVTKFGKARIISHLKAIRTGKYCRATAMKDLVGTYPAS